MIVLDTNVVSELMRAVPEAAVLSWLRRRDSAQLATTTITVADIGAGLAVLPEGQRRRDLASRWDRLRQAGFGQRVFASDEAAAAVYGEIYAARRRIGRPAGGFDLRIAAIARCRKAAVATRNVGEFDGCRVDLVDPWTALTGPEE